MGYRGLQRLFLPLLQKESKRLTEEEKKCNNVAWGRNAVGAAGDLLLLPGG